MSTASVRSARLAAGLADEPQNRVGRWLAAIAILGLLAFLIAWLAGWIRLTTDPRVAEIKQLQNEARQKFAVNGGPQTLAEATEAVTAMVQIRQKVEALPEHLRPQAERSGGSMFRSAMRQRIDAYFSLPPEKRMAELDRQIKQEEMMRKAFEAAGTVAGFFGGGSRTNAEGNAGGASTGGTPSGGTPSGPMGGPPRGGTEEDRNRWRKQIIDTTTPEQRARYVEYRRAMDQRREQLGLPAAGPPR